MCPLLIIIGCAWRHMPFRAKFTFVVVSILDTIYYGEYPNASFLFFSPFSKDSLKYAPGGKISKNGPLSWRHSCRRQDITAWRQGQWRHDPAVVALTWQGAWRYGSWRQALAPRTHVLAIPSPPESFSFSFSHSSVFSFVHFGQPLQSTY
jgi:hypothetical protein